MDWVAQIKAGAATLKVHFTGGTLTVYGVTPAEYTTDNPFVQRVIEQSKYFKEGRITLLKSIEIKNSGKGKNKQVKASACVLTQLQKGKGESLRASALTQHSVRETSKENQNPASGNEENNSEGVGSDSKPEESAIDETEDFIEVEVSCLQDAQDYLQQEFNIASYKVRTRETAQRAANEHGVRFVGGTFDTPKNSE